MCDVRSYELLGRGVQSSEFPLWRGTQICYSKPAILIEFNDVDSNNLAGYEERTRVLYMILSFHICEVSASGHSRFYYGGLGGDGVAQRT